MGPGLIISSISMLKKTVIISHIRDATNSRHYPESLGNIPPIVLRWNEETRRRRGKLCSSWCPQTMDVGMIRYIKKQWCIVKQWAGCALYRRLYLEITLLCAYECTLRHVILSRSYALMTHYLCMGIPRWNFYRSAVSISHLCIYIFYLATPLSRSSRHFFGPRCAEVWSSAHFTSRPARNHVPHT